MQGLPDHSLGGRLFGALVAHGHHYLLSGGNNDRRRNVEPSEDFRLGPPGFPCSLFRFRRYSVSGEDNDMLEDMGDRMISLATDRGPAWKEHGETRSGGSKVERSGWDDVAVVRPPRMF